MPGEHDQTTCDFAGVDVDVLCRANRLCDEFEAAFRSGAGPRIEDYVGDLPITAHPELLWEFILVEWELRCKDGENPNLSEYVKRFPNIDRTFFTRAAQANPPAPQDSKTATEILHISDPKKTVGAAGQLTNPFQTMSPVPLTDIHIGDYVIEEEIARGGMGVVYRARQLNLKRTVALKMILAGQLASEREVQRFRLEAESAGNLDHPNIVPIYEVGEDGGRHFFSMKLIDGDSLTQHQPRLKNDYPRMAQLSAKVARAVHHAHQRGILHRDLKPANILIDSRGEPHVTDFGLAKHTEGKSKAEHSYGPIGTPGYMPPEQVDSSAGHLTMATDVYALGAVLYQLLTGRPPFIGDNPARILQQVMNDEPATPSSLHAGVPLDLETICLKCLRKEPAKRYETAEALAQDLDRFVNHEPITARRVSRRERALKWIKRNKGLAASLTAVFLVLVLGSVVSTLQAIRATIAERQAKENERSANTLKERAEKLAEAERKAKEDERIAKQDALEQLDFGRQAIYATQLSRVGLIYERDPFRAAALLRDCRFCPTDRRCAAWLFYERQCDKWFHALLPRHKGGVFSLCFSPEGAILATGGGDGAVKLWNLKTKKILGRLNGHSRKVSSVCFSPDGKLLASASGPTVLLWDVKKWRVLRRIQGKVRAVRSVRFSPDGGTIAFGTARQDIHLLHLKTGRATNLPGDKFGCFSVCFSPDGQTLATAHYGAVKLWNLKTRKVIDMLNGHTGSIHAVDFSPDGATLASAGADKTIVLWDVKTRRKLAAFHGNAKRVSSLQFSPDGKMLASGGSDQSVRLWDIQTGQEMTTIMAHTRGVNAIQFSPDGTKLASGDSYAFVVVWNVRPRQEMATLRGAGGELCFQNEQILAAASHRDEAIRLWNLQTGQEMARLPGHTRGVESICICPAGKLLASAARDRTVKIWNLASQRVLTTLPLHKKGYSPGLCFSPDGASLAIGSFDIVKIWNVNTGQPLATLRGHKCVIKSICFSPDGKTLASADSALDVNTKLPAMPAIKIWDVENRRAIATLTGHKIRNPINCIDFSPDGTLLASASMDTTVKLWNVKTQKLITTLKGHTAGVESVCFSPDGRTLASAGDSTVRLWDIRTLQEIATLKGHAAGVRSVCFSPDGTILASGDGGAVKLWDLRASNEYAELHGHVNWVRRTQFSQDGQLLKSTDAHGESLYWDLNTGQQLKRKPETKFLKPSLEEGPNGRFRAKLDKMAILIKDVTKPSIKTINETYDAYLPHWHRHEAERAKKQLQWFAAGFHYGQLANAMPQDAGIRLEEARAWAKAKQPERAARAFVQAALIGVQRD